MKRLAIVAFLLFLFNASAFANPFLPRAGERATTLRVATSAVTGGFVHFYAGLDYGIFEKYGLKCEHIYIRGQSPALAALAGDQLQFTYGAADGSLPGLAAGVEAKIVASPLVKLPYVVQAILVTPPLDVRAKHDGFNVIYRLVDLEIPFIYSSLLTNYKMLRERPETVQRMVAALAETVYFVEKNPDKAKAAIAKAMRVKDEEALQSSYNVYAKEIVDRTMVVPSKSVSEAIDIARETGTLIRRKPEELYDNSFVNNLEKSGFLKELWGSENYRR